MYKSFGVKLGVLTGNLAPGRINNLQDKKSVQCCFILYVY